MSSPRDGTADPDMAIQQSSSTKSHVSSRRDSRVSETSPTTASPQKSATSEDALISLRSTVVEIEQELAPDEGKAMVSPRQQKVDSKPSRVRAKARGGMGGDAGNGQATRQQKWQEPRKPAISKAHRSGSGSPGIQTAPTHKDRLGAPQSPQTGGVPKRMPKAKSRPAVNGIATSPVKKNIPGIPSQPLKANSQDDMQGTLLGKESEPEYPRASYPLKGDDDGESLRMNFHLHKQGTKVFGLKKSFFSHLLNKPKEVKKANRYDPARTELGKNMRLRKKFAQLEHPFKDSPTHAWGYMAPAELKVWVDQLSDHWDELKVACTLHDVALIINGAPAEKEAEGSEDMMATRISEEQFLSLLVMPESTLEHRARCDAHLSEEERCQVQDLRKTLVKVINKLIPEDAVAKSLQIERRALEEDDEDDIGKTIVSWLEPIMGIVILLSAVMIGLSTDVAWDGWVWLEIFCTMLFVLEILLKLAILTPRGFFIGEGCYWNVFDLFMAILAGIDAVTTLATKTPGALSKSVVLPVVRMLRLARLIRLVRLMRLFKELSLIVNGLLRGMRTMGWSMLLMLVLVYMMAVVLTSEVGKRDSDDAEVIDSFAHDNTTHVKTLFGTVPRSMFTVFRCFTDGCSSLDGTPILTKLYELFGMWFVLGYCLCTLLMTFGLFNLVMAIIVESTMANSQQTNLRSDAQRRLEYVKLGKQLKCLIQLMAEEEQRTQQRKLGKRAVTSEFVHQSMHDKRKTPAQRLLKRVTVRNQPVWQRWYHRWCWWARNYVSEAESEEDEEEFDLLEQADLVITRDVFERLLRKPEVGLVLDAIQVDEADRPDLFDVLDADGSGAVSAEEIVEGILQVRGPARKVDVVAVRLMLRSVQDTIKYMCSMIIQQSAQQHSIDARIDGIESRLDTVVDQMSLLINGMDSISKASNPKATSVPLSSE